MEMSLARRLTLALLLFNGVCAKLTSVPGYDQPVEIVDKSSDEGKALIQDAFNFLNTFIYRSKPRALVQILEIARQNSNGIDYQLRLVIGTSLCPNPKQSFCGLGNVVDTDVVYMFRSSNKTLAKTEAKYRLVYLPHERCPKPIQHAGAFGQSMIPIPPIEGPPVRCQNVDDKTKAPATPPPTNDDAVGPPGI